MRPLLERLRSGDVLLADGALGTLLLPFMDKEQPCPESLNLRRADILEDIAGAYLESGADVVQTNTFGASPLKLAGYGLQASTEQIVVAAVEAVKRAVRGRAYVSGSCGPTGVLLKPYGDVDSESVSGAFVRQMEAFGNSGVDCLCVETMIDLQEAVLAVQAAKKTLPDVPVLATMVFTKTPRGYFTVMGTDIRTACDGLQAAGADAVGSNCGNGISEMVEIAREFQRHTDLPIVIQSNAGLPEIRKGALCYPETPVDFARCVADMVGAGVQILGGCCGTTPAHIRAMRQALEACI